MVLLWTTSQFGYNLPGDCQAWLRCGWVFIWCGWFRFGVIEFCLVWMSLVWCDRVWFHVVDFCLILKTTWMKIVLITLGWKTTPIFFTLWGKTTNMKIITLTLKAQLSSWLHDIWHAVFVVQVSQAWIGLHTGRRCAAAVVNHCPLSRAAACNQQESADCSQVKTTFKNSPQLTACPGPGSSKNSQHSPRHDRYNLHIDNHLSDCLYRGGGGRPGRRGGGGQAGLGGEWGHDEPRTSHPHDNFCFSRY